MNRSAQRGVTLVESLTAVAIAAIVTSSAMSGYQNMLQRRQVEGVSSELYADLQFARTTAFARSTNVRMSFHNSGNGSCYVIHTGPADACTCQDGEPATCTGLAVPLKTVNALQAGPAQITANQPSMVFDSIRGTVTPSARIDVTGRDGKSLRHTVSSLGRTTTCAVSGGFVGYKPCTGTSAL